MFFLMFSFVLPSTTRHLYSLIHLLVRSFFFPFVRSLAILFLISLSTEYGMKRESNGIAFNSSGGGRAKLPILLLMLFSLFLPDTIVSVSG